MANDVHVRLRAFCGPEKYLKLIDKLQVSSRTDYELVWWIENQFKRFVSQDTEFHSVPELLEAILEPRFFQYRCPEKACTHIVVYISGIWGCGECGKTWASTEALFEAISTAIAIFPYRAGCYVLARRGYEPSTATAYFPNYYSLVHEEWSLASG